MIGRILIPVDSSPFAKAASRYAVLWAKVFQARVTGLFVEDASELMETQIATLPAGAPGEVPVIVRTGGDVEGLLEKAREEARSLFEQAAQGLDLAIDFVSYRGRIEPTILAEVEGQDLLVVGKAGVSREKGRRLGVHIRGIISKSPVPVMVVEKESELPKRVLVAFNASRPSVRALAIVAECAGRIEAEVEVAYIGDDEEAEAIFSRARKYLLPFGLSEKYRLLKGAVAEALIERAREFDLVAMGAYGENMLKELLLGSTTQEVLLGVSVPLLLSN